MENLVTIITIYTLAFVWSYAVGTALESVIVLLKGSVKVDTRSAMDRLFDGGIAV
jgi:hypothetical protein